MKMETLLHQLDEPARRGERRSSDGCMDGRTDARIVWIHSRGSSKEISRSRSRPAADKYR